MKAHPESNNTTNRVLTKMAENVNTIINHSRRLLEKNQFDSALTMSQKGLEIIDDAQLWLIQGIAHYHLSSFEKALFCLNHALNIDPSLIEAIDFKKQLLSNMEQYNEILEDIKQADDGIIIQQNTNPQQAANDKINHIQENQAFLDLHFSDKGHHDEWFAEGYSLYKSRAFDESLLCFDNTIKLKSSHKKAHLYRALALYYMGEADKAKESFKQASKNFPKYSKLWYKRSLIHFLEKEYQEALEFINYALDLEPENQKYKERKIRIMIESSMLEEALDTLKVWLKDDPDQPSFRLLKHEVLILLKGDEALREIRAELEQDEDDPSLWHSFISLLIRKSNFNEALEAVNHAIDIYPEDDDLLIQKGEIFLGLKKYNEANRLFDESLEADDENDYLWYLKGLSALALKDYDTAIEMFNTALEINEDFEKASFYKAKALIYCKEPDLARKILKDLLVKSNLGQDVKQEAHKLISKII